MDFVSDPTLDRFRAEVRAFISEKLPPDIARRGWHDYHSTRPDVQRWMEILNQRGWAAPHWPVEYGGTGWTPTQNFIWQEELRLAGAPVYDRAGIELVGPVIYTFGTREQKSYFLPKILSGEHWWCQGFSEPGAGSDLASLRTRADLDGDHYIVNGQKTWTSEAHWADWIFMLVRTDQTVRPQAGISFLLIDMKSAGLTRRPIWTIDEGLTLNETFFDNVRVPQENLVGQAGKGWTYAKFLLTNERTFSAEVPHSKRDILQLRRIGAQVSKNGKPLDQDPIFRAKMAKAEIDVIALEWAVLRLLHAEGVQAETSVASVVKTRGGELRQILAELSAQALGDHGIAVMPDPEGLHKLRSDGLAPPVIEEGIGVVSKAIFRRATTIYGGANEIQRTIIAKTVLGL
jgi:alkylation response protein AidB-like acyl-CoA dehydrogenase